MLAVAAPALSRDSNSGSAVLVASGHAASGGGATAPTGDSGATEPTTSPTPTAPLEGKVVTIDPGHNGANGAHPGEINRTVDAGGLRKACDTTGTETADGKLSESAFNFDVAKRLRTLLRKRGAKVVFTRPNDRGVGPCITRRARIGNKARSDAAISIHADGGPPGGRGFHVIEPGVKNSSGRRMRLASHKLALAMRRELLGGGLKASNYVARNGIDTRSDLGGLNLSTVPKVFVELGNMRNGAEQRRLESARWRQRAAKALADGLERRLAK